MNLLANTRRFSNLGWCIVLMIFGSTGWAQSAPASPIQFAEKMPLREALKHYLVFEQRMLIVGPRVNLQKKIDLPSDRKLNTSEAFAAIKAGAKSAKLVLREEGGIYLLLVREQDAKRIPKIKPVNLAAKNRTPEVAHLVFDAMPITQVISVYADLKGRKFKASSGGVPFVNAQISVPLTKEEIITGLDALFALHNVKVREGKDGLEASIAGKQIERTDR